MARIRSIKPSFWESESLATRLPGADGRQARLLFIALWSHAEDHGVCRASSAYLRSKAFPYDDDVTAEDISRWLHMLGSGRFIVLYQRDGSTYAWIRGFSEHQKIDRKSQTSLPEPSEQERTACASPRATIGRPAGETVGATSSPRRALVEPSSQDGKGGEWKVIGVEGGSASQGASDATPAAEQVVLVDVSPVPQPEKPKRAPNTSALGEFIDWARAEVKPRLPADGMDPAKGLTQPERNKLGEAVKHHGLETLKAAFRLFMGWHVSETKGYSVGFFANQWEKWVQQAKAPPASNSGMAPPDDERMRALREAVAAKRAEQARKAAGGAS